MELADRTLTFADVTGVLFVQFSQIVFPLRSFLFGHAVPLLVFKTVGQGDRVWLWKILNDL